MSRHIPNFRVKIEAPYYYLLCDDVIIHSEESSQAMLKYLIWIDGMNMSALATIGRGRMDLHEWSLLKGEERIAVMLDRRMNV